MKCSKCGGELKPTGAVTDMNPAIIHFRCETCGAFEGIFEDDESLLKNPISE